MARLRAVKPSSPTCGYPPNATMSTEDMAVKVGFLGPQSAISLGGGNQLSLPKSSWGAELLRATCARPGHPAAPLPPAAACGGGCTALPRAWYVENLQISSKVLNVTTIRSWSLWTDSSLADSSCRGKTRKLFPWHGGVMLPTVAGGPGRRARSPDLPLLGSRARQLLPGVSMASGPSQRPCQLLRHRQVPGQTGTWNASGLG